eukprot:GHUV01054466.1.p1 GENE.GHUV01054466.1~~GHUV01054466.1.p1  ORF type:complete len:146 (-),score=24.27 GHUV01054466.1:417-854(-)
MPSATKLEKKEAYHQRLCDYLNTYERAFIVGADNVGSKQMSDIRAVSLTRSAVSDQLPQHAAVTGTSSNVEHTTEQQRQNNSSTPGTLAPLHDSFHCRVCNGKITLQTFWGYARFAESGTALFALCSSRTAVLLVMHMITAQCPV